MIEMLKLLNNFVFVLLLLSCDSNSDSKNHISTNETTQPNRTIDFDIHHYTSIDKYIDSTRNNYLNFHLCDFFTRINNDSLYRKNNFSYQYIVKNNTFNTDSAVNRYIINDLHFYKCVDCFQTLNLDNKEVLIRHLNNIEYTSDDTFMSCLIPHQFKKIQEIDTAKKNEYFFVFEERDTTRFIILHKFMFNGKLLYNVVNPEIISIDYIFKE